MTRLTSLPARIGPAPARLGRAPRQTEGPKRIRDSNPLRPLYSTAAWQRTRQEVLVRDAYTCQAKGCGRICAGKHPAEDSPVVDHIKPPRGNAALFWGKTNLQTLCKSPCHDKHKQTQEQDSLKHRGVWD